MVALSFLPFIFFVASKHNLLRDQLVASSLSTRTTSLLAESSSSSQTTLLEVCMSPGCIADGADNALLQLQALSPPGTLVKPGGCISLCGSGPVVFEKNKKHRKVSVDKVLTILFGDDEDGAISDDVQAVVSGLKLVSDAQDAAKKGNHDEAVGLFEQAIETGLEAAKRLENKRQQNEGQEDASSGLQWVLQARLGETQSRLQVGDSEGAVRSAEAGQDLFEGNNSSPPLELLELLHQAYQTNGDDAGELKALQAFFAEPVPEKQTTMQANKRRQLGFRLAKLERELC